MKMANPTYEPVIRALRKLFGKRLRTIVLFGSRARAGRDLVWKFPEIPRKEWELNWEGYRELG